MNPFLLLGVAAVIAGLIIEQVQKKKQAEDDSPVEPVEVSPNESETISNGGGGGANDSPDSGDIPASEIPKNTGNSSIKLDS